MKRQPCDDSEKRRLQCDDKAEIGEIQLAQCTYMVYALLFKTCMLQTQPYRMHFHWALETVLVS